jgi:hypothetical protein
MFKIDVFIQKKDPFSENVMARRILYQITEEKGQGLYLATAEDIILSKLEWYEAGGREPERQWTDVLGVLQVCSNNLDIMYLKESAEKRNLADLLNEAFEAAGIHR